MAISTQALVKINSKDYVDVEVGDLLLYKYALRDEMGIDAGCIVDNKDVVALVDDHVTHISPMRSYEEHSDGPENIRTRSSFLFKAISKGKANIIIKHEWQGNVHKTYKITVNVK